MAQDITFQAITLPSWSMNLRSLMAAGGQWDNVLTAEITWDIQTGQLTRQARFHINWQALFEQASGYAGVHDGGMGGTLSETRILELRQCVIARQPANSPQGELIVSGSDLVHGYRQCRNGTDGEEIAAFRTVMDGFAQPLEGKWPQFKLAISP